MNRRAFLGKAALAPIAGPIAAKEVVTGAMSGPVGGLSTGNVGYNEPSPLVRKFWHAREILEAKRHVKESAQYSPHPHHIAERRSWSSAFKSHVWVEQETARRVENMKRDPFGFREKLDDSAMMQVIRAAGLDE
jgi:hypothetical protein